MVSGDCSREKPQKWPVYMCVFVCVHPIFRPELFRVSDIFLQIMLCFVLTLMPGDTCSELSGC